MHKPDDVSINQKKGRTTLLVILGLFVLPILVVLAMYQFSLRPGGSSHGELINPPRQLHLSPMTTWQNKPFSPVGVHEKWSLLYVMPPVCAAPCAAQVRMMRQIHAALDKEIGRVQRIVLVAGTPETAQLDAMQRDYPDLIILAKPADAVAELAAQLRIAEPAGGSTYLIDPQGNAMMRYIPTADPNGIRKDLMHLLKYSWTG